MDAVKTKETFELLAAAARRLGVPARWLKSEAEAGRLPALRIGKRFLFNVAQVELALLQRAENGLRKNDAKVTQN